GVVHRSDLRPFARQSRQPNPFLLDGARCPQVARGSPKGVAHGQCGTEPLGALPPITSGRAGLAEPVSAVPESGEELARGQTIAHLAGPISTVLGVAQAQLARHIHAPTLDVSGGEQRACVLIAYGNAGGDGAGAQIDRDKHRALAGLAGRVVPPAPDGAV